MAVWNVVNREILRWETQNSVNNETSEFNNSDFFASFHSLHNYFTLKVFRKPPQFTSPVSVVCNTDQAVCMAEEVLFCRLSAEPEIK